MQRGGWRGWSLAGEMKEWFEDSFFIFSQQRYRPCLKYVCGTTLLDRNQRLDASSNDWKLMSTSL